MNSLILDDRYPVAARHVGEPRHALPVRIIGLESGIVAMCTDDRSRSRLRLQTTPDALAATDAVYAATQTHVYQTTVDDREGRASGSACLGVPRSAVVAIDRTTAVVDAEARDEAHIVLRARWNTVEYVSCRTNQVQHLLNTEELQWRLCTD